jgi:WD40 repeat protein
VQFRNIRIRELIAASAPSAAAVATPQKWRDHAPGLIWAMPTGPDWWHRAAISPTGNFIAAGRLTEGGKDKESVRIHLWPINDQQDGSQSFVVRHPVDGKRERNTIEGLVFSSDGKLLVSSALDGSICLWDVSAASPKMLSRIQPYDWCVDGLDISPDGRWLAAVGRTAGVPVMVWDISNPAEPREKTTLAQNEKEITDTIAFTRTGTTLLLAPTIADAEARVLAWDFENGKTTRTIWKGPLPKGWIRWLRESPEGDRVGFCANEQALVVDARTGEVLATFAGHGKTVNGFVFMPDGERCVTSSYDGTIRMWSASTGLQLWQSDQFHGGNEGLAISSDGQLAMAVSHGGGSITDEKGNLAQLWRLPD